MPYTFANMSAKHVSQAHMLAKHASPAYVSHAEAPRYPVQTGTKYDLCHFSGEDHSSMQSNA